MRKLLMSALAFAPLMPPAMGFTAREVSAQIGDGVELSAFVDFYYAYAFNKTDPSLRSFDVLHNAFSMSLAEVALEKAASQESRVGGRIDLDFGPTADLVASFEPAGGTEVFKHVQQAYLSVLAGESLTLDFGKFVTPHGAEVIESQGNWNYTRSILFGYAIPFYHAGVRATVAASDQVSLSGFLVNGWNNTTETNADKTFAGSVALTPNDQVTWFATFMAGKEADNDGDGEEDLRWLFDTTVSFAATDMVTLMANFDYGKDANYIATGEDATWWGIAAYLRLQAQENWALAGRYEYVNDSEGGWMTIGEKAQSFTLTSDHMLDELIARVEFRMDIAESDDFFTKDDGSGTSNQPSLIVGMVVPLG